MSKKVIKKNNRNFIPTPENTHYTKKGAKAKWSFWVVLALMLFWSVGAVLGIFATARSCNDSSSVKTVSAAEIEYVGALRIDMVYNNEKFFTFDINGKGTSSKKDNYDLVVKCLYNFSVENCIYVISRNGVLPGSFVMRNLTEGSFSEVKFNVHTEDNPFDNGYQLYSFFGRSFNCQYISDFIRNGLYGTYDFDLTFIITSKTPFNLQIPVLYENGFLNDICEAAQSKDNESLGFFTGGTFRVANRNIKAFDEWLNTMTESDYSGLPYSSLPLLPSEYIVGFYNGVLNSFKSKVVDDICGYPSSNGAVWRYLFCDFGEKGKPFGEYTKFSVFVKEGDTFYGYGYAGCAISFIFTDGSVVGPYLTDNPPLSYIDVSEYSNKRVRSVLWLNANTSSYFSGLTSGTNNLADYVAGFNAGKGQGYNDGYKNGYSVGKSDGKVIGRNEALASGNNYTFLGLLGAVVDAPITAISGLLNFNLLGFNMLNFFYALCTCALVIAVVRLIL